jgi:trans-aconitate 2-methyltransferase
MIAKARGLHPEGNWVVAGLADYEAEPFDVVFANAVIQWLPDHARLLPRLMALVAPGGHLAVQVPNNPESPVRAAMVRAARHPRFGGALKGAGETLTFHDPRFYYEHLAPIAAAVDVWQTTYHHLFPGHEAIVAWWQSTGMRPYLERLQDPLDQAFFKDLVLASCREAFPVCADGRLLMPFQRLFFVARK